jgi:hypothetical protein
MTHTFYCQSCHQVKKHESDLTTGYGRSKHGVLICYACCGELDRKRLMTQDRAILYLAKESSTTYSEGQAYQWVVSNWPGTFKRQVHVSKGRHNIAGVRYDTTFLVGGKLWYGTRYGDNTQILHCKAYKNQDNQKRG